MPHTRNDPIDQIDNYINLCLTKEYSPSSVIIYNDTPWSHIFNSNTESQLDKIKLKIYNELGWKPNLIINIKVNNNSQSYKSLLEQTVIPVINVDGDHKLLDNLISILG